MIKESICETERRNLDRFRRFQLAPRYKHVGIWAFVITLIALISLKYIDPELVFYKTLIKKIMLLSLLVIAISKEDPEDERIQKLRGQSFSMAFIAGVIYALVQPYIDYLVAFVIKTQEATYTDMGDFQVLWFMLVIHIMFFHLLKRID